jgi:hypothetical protein
MGADIDKMMWRFDEALGGSVKKPTVTAIASSVPGLGRDEL